MKQNHLCFVALTFGLSGCLLKDYQGDKVISPTGNYSISIEVNKTDLTKDDYSEVVFRVFDKQGKEFNRVNTGAGDFSGWAVTWTIYGDTVVLESSDIGNSAWKIVDGELVKIPWSDDFNKVFQIEF